VSAPPATLAARRPWRLVRAVVRERVLWALAAGLAALALADPGQGAASARFVLAALADIAPFLLLAVLLAGAVKASGADALIARAFSGHPLGTVVAAALVGALSPFCSCGVIPLVAALLAAGVPLAPVMAFWIASPIMDPEMFVLTAAGIGLGFAVAKTAATVAMGLLAGLAVLALRRAGFLAEPLRRQAGACGCRPPLDPAAPVTVAWRFWRDPGRRALFTTELLATGAFLGKWLALAFFLESLMVAYLDPAWVGAALGGGGAGTVALAALVGVPAYLNGYAAIPLIGGLLELGMDRGAALAFMTAGAVSSIPAAIAVWALVKRPVFALYLGLGLAGSILTGLAYGLAAA